MQVRRQTCGDKEVWRRATRPNALLLSTAVTLNSEQLKPIFDWFHDNVHIAGVGGWANNFSVEWCNGNRKSEVVRFFVPPTWRLATCESSSRTSHPKCSQESCLRS